MSNKIKILLVTSAGFSAKWAEELSGNHSEIDFVITSDCEELVSRHVVGCDALIGCPRHFVSSELLSKAKNLKWIHAGGAGVDALLIPELVDSDICLTNGRIIQGPEVADHALGLVLSLSRNISRLLKGEHKQDMPRAIELRAKTGLVFGLGGIGLLIAERFKAFGMKTIGIYNDLPPMISALDEMYPSSELDKVLPHCEVVVSAAPLTASTKQIFNYERLCLMKRDSIFVNVSRGGLVDTSALVKLLADGRFRGVGLDVTEPEPLNADHPLWGYPNVLITPHMAGPSDHNRRRSFDLISENIKRFQLGEKLLNIVDKREGY